MRGEPILIALAGNPNVGKSTVFNRLTGLRQHTGNWAGKTVSLAVGSCESERHRYTLTDLPGTYSLLAHSAEEEAARDFLNAGQAEAVIVVCDASCLARNLNLLLQILALTPRVLLCVNLMDEAARHGLTLDLPLLAERLGIPVIGVSAREKGSRETILRALDALIDGPLPRPHCLPVLPPEADEDAVTAALLHRAAALCEGVVRQSDDAKPRRDEAIDRLLTSRWLGYPLMLLLLALILYLSVLGANPLSDALSALFGWVELRLNALVAALGFPDFWRGLLIDGAWRVLAWVTAVMLPPMAIFFPLFTLLEDLGYLPRVAYNLDRPFQRCHACGKQALTLCMGFGCNAVGVTGCRIIDAKRERMLAMLTNSLVPCNGRFPLLLTLLGLFFAGGSALRAALGLTGLLVFSVMMSLAATRLLSATLLRGLPSSFVLELPPYRRPQLGQILLRSVLDRTLFVLGRAAAVAAPAGMLLWLLANLAPGGVSLLSRCAAALDPLGRFFGMDGVILLAFLLALPANETVLPVLLMVYAGGSVLTAPGDLQQFHALLLQQGWTGNTALCVLVFCLFHWPCSTTLLTIRKESGSWGWTLLAALLPTGMGLSLCALIAAATRLLA